MEKNKSLSSEQKPSDTELLQSIKNKLKNYDPSQASEPSFATSSVKYDGPFYDYEVKDYNPVDLDEELEDSIQYDYN